MTLAGENGRNVARVADNLSSDGSSQDEEAKGDLARERIRELLYKYSDPEGHDFLDDEFALEDENNLDDASDLDDLYPDRISFAGSFDDSEEIHSRVLNYRNMLYGKPGEVYKHSTWYCGYYSSGAGTKIRNFLKEIVETNWFQQGILFSIFVNLIILSVSCH